MDELPDVPALRVLEPPPGGLATLRTRLAAPRRRWWRIALPAVAAAAIVAIIVTMGRGREPLPSPAAPATAIRDPEVATDVGFYWVASTPGKRIRSAPTTVSIDQVPEVGDFALR